MQCNCSILNLLHSLIYAGIRRHKNDRKSVHDIDRTADNNQSLSPFKDIYEASDILQVIYLLTQKMGKEKREYTLWCGGGVLGYVFGFISTVFAIPKWTCLQ